MKVTKYATNKNQYQPGQPIAKSSWIWLKITKIVSDGIFDLFLIKKIWKEVFSLTSLIHPSIASVK